ncbi:DUF1707 SHOCT-like domain-containing protein [Granulicoccus phenolivorans]|uniref:DUF1707 SHOCT-like domain-containing protein n=1 Tax=Granulicoccus phenolivorans TaxID=266854 RepID=UPI00138B1432|nr:DUF1707 domain-containing protein [Granulicoccus phenolivorans]
MTVPARPEPPGGDRWSSFSGDPRTQGHLRASDADRDTAHHLIAEAYAEGRLSHEEFELRNNQLLQVRELGALVPLLSDLVPDAQPAARRPRGRIPGPVRSWLSVTVVVNVIWLVTAIASRGFYYYWPIWPMLGMFLAVLVPWMFGTKKDEQPPSDRGQLPGNLHRPDDLR